MASTVYVALYRPDGTLVYKEADYGDGLTGQENSLKSNLECVAIFVKREQGTNVFWDSYSGNSAYKFEAGSDGVNIYSHDTTGSNRTRLRHYTNTGGIESVQDIPSQLADAVMGGGATLVVLDEGSGSLYEQKLAEARSYMISNYGAVL